MMRINTKVRYGLRAITEIGRQSNENGIIQKEISQSQDIPLNYLDSIISSLRNAGLIRNMRGRGSGYILARDASDISVYDVYRAFEPEISLTACNLDKTLCHRSGECQLSDHWCDLSNMITSIMRTKTLKELIIPEGIEDKPFFIEDQNV